MSGCIEFSSQPAQVFTSDDMESHHVFFSVLSSSWPATPILSPAALCRLLPLPLGPSVVLFLLSSLPLLSHLCCGCVLARGQVMTWAELQMSVWGRTLWRAVGASWAVPASFCFLPPRCLESAHFSAAPGFSSHLVNLQSLKLKEGGREGLRQTEAGGEGGV